MEFLRKNFKSLWSSFKINNITVHGDASDDMKKLLKALVFIQTYESRGLLDDTNNK